MRYELHINMTGKGYGRGSRWEAFADIECHYFGSMVEVQTYLRERYGKARRMAMYRDQKAGPPIKCGWVIGFRNADYSHAPVSHWLQQDWVELRQSEPVALA